MIRSLLSHSHIIIPHIIQSQPTLEPVEACFIVLLRVTPTCVCCCCTLEQFFPTLGVAECKTTSAVSRAKWGQVKYKKTLGRGVEEATDMCFAKGQRRLAAQSARVGKSGRRSPLNCVLWKSDFFFQKLPRTARIDTFCCDCVDAFQLLRYSK